MDTNHYKIIGSILGIVIVAIGAILYQNNMRPLPMSETVSKIRTARTEKERPINTINITVHIAGAVKQPGVYQVEKGKRTLEILKSAGGTVASADLDKINLASKPKDGARLYIPYKKNKKKKRKSTNALNDSKNNTKKIKLKTASQSELTRIPGIGPKMAYKIIEYRQKNPIKRNKDLLNIKGIGEKKLKKIAPFLEL